VIDAWVEKLREVIGTADSDTYLVGHSIGCQTILRYLETIDTPVGGAIFVAGWFDLENLEDEETARIAAPWINTPIDIEKIREVLPKSSLLISDNDPFGCLKMNKARFSEIVTKITVVPGAAHFSLEDGFTELPAILEEFDFFTHSESLAEALKNG
jgi:predicted alpha/beta hydrolase family esterase